MILHKCGKSGCKELISTDKRYCDKHTNYYSRQYDRLRMRNVLTRDYRLFYQSKEWKQLRELKLSNNPLCERCLLQHKHTIATDVHHVHDVFYHWNERTDLSNLQSLCKSCHEKIHKLGYYNSRN